MTLSTPVGPGRVAIYIDPPTYHFLGDKLFSTDFLNGDQCNMPFVYLREVFGRRGIEVRTADYLPKEVDDICKIYVSLGRLSGYRQLARRSDTVLSAFFAMECPIGAPWLYRELRTAQDYFKRVYSWSDSASLERFVGSPLRCRSFRWPQAFDAVHADTWQRTNRKFLVMINTNKRSPLNWQELYTERLRAVEFFSRTGEIDLYGVGWDVPSYRIGSSMPYPVQRVQRLIASSWQRLYPDPLLQAARRVYRGRAVSKSDVLSQYTFALCFENMILKGWVTEKIFDCLYAGTIPVYWGAPDIAEHVDENCYIDMTKFANYSELRSFLRSMTAEQINGYKEAAREYLKSEKFKPSSKEAFVELFEGFVQEDVSVLVRAPSESRQ